MARLPPQKQSEPGSSTPRPLRIPGDAEAPLRQTRVCVAGLLTLAALRGCAVNVYTSPTGLAWTAHMLSCAADAISMLGSLPVFLTSTIGACIHHRCLGSLLTLLLTTTVCDIGAIVIFLSTQGSLFHLFGPIGTEQGAPAAMSFIGVWECVLVSSTSLQVALCVSAWQFYRAFREAGIYPPNNAQLRVRKDVSALEFLCEAEDVALLSDQCNSCRHGSEEDGLWPEDVVRSSERHVAYGYAGLDEGKLQHHAMEFQDQVVNRL